VDENNIITDFVEKPQHFVSDLAIIGIYYFNDGDWLKKELQYLLDNNIREKGEYQLTNALENMKKKGARFSPGAITEWLDCGNKDATVFTNQRVLEFLANENMVHPSAQLNNATLVQPCYIGENCVLENSVVGPHVSLGKGCKISSSVVSNSIIQDEALITNAVVSNSMMGKAAGVEGRKLDLSISDYSTLIV
jgi:glucose-1-phosphate thymidylyltransferase